MEKLSSDTRAAVSLESIVLLTESALLGRENMSCVGVSSPGKDPSEARKSSSSVLNVSDDDAAAVVGSVDVTRFGRVS